MSGAFTTRGIAENTAEDAVDEGISNLVYALGNQYFGDGKNAKDNNLVKAAFDEALEGAGQTLKFSIMNAAIFRSSAYILPKILGGSAAIFTYIKAGRIINSVKRSVSNGLGGIPLVGRFLGGAVKTSVEIAVGNQNERLAMANIASNNMDSYTTALGKEREIATHQVSAQKKQVMSTLGLNHKSKGLNDSKKIEAYHYKMKSGTWVNNSQDQRLFYAVVPKEYIQQGFKFTSSFVEKLNGFSEYARDTENQIVNVAQTNLDLMTTNNLSSIN
ncbi:MAG: SLT domain-containing protein [Arcobacteraceae bacterium]|jgi:SLT domain-containing protein